MEILRYLSRSSGTVRESIPTLLKRARCRYSERWSTYLSMMICASKPGPIIDLANGPSSIGAKMTLIVDHKILTVTLFNNVLLE